MDRRGLRPLRTAIPGIAKRKARWHRFGIWLRYVAVQNYRPTSWQLPWPSDGHHWDMAIEVSMEQLNAFISPCSTLIILFFQDNLETKKLLKALSGTRLPLQWLRKHLLPHVSICFACLNFWTRLALSAFPPACEFWGGTTHVTFGKVQATQMPSSRTASWV